MIAIGDRTAPAFKISPGQDRDAPVGRDLIRGLADAPEEGQSSHGDAPEEGRRCLVTDRAYEGDQTRKAAQQAGFTPVIPPKTARINGSTTKRSTNSETRSSGCSTA